MWRRLDLVKSDVSEERVAFFFGVDFLPSRRGDTLFRNVEFYKTQTCHIPEEDVFHSSTTDNRAREVKMYVTLTYLIATLSIFLFPL
jgi:hypothetical protein